MSESSSSGKLSYAAIGMALGLFFGGVLGLIADNLIFFAGGGLVIGFALGASLDRRRKAIDA